MNDRFKIRDIVTKKVIKTFRNELAARSYFYSMSFNMYYFYEVFDEKLNMVIFYKK